MSKLALSSVDTATLITLLARPELTPKAREKIQKELDTRPAPEEMTLYGKPLSKVSLEDLNRGLVQARRHASAMSACHFVDLSVDRHEPQTMTSARYMDSSFDKVDRANKIVRLIKAEIDRRSPK